MYDIVSPCSAAPMAAPLSFAILRSTLIRRFARADEEDGVRLAVPGGRKEVGLSTLSRTPAALTQTVVFRIRAVPPSSCSAAAL